MTAVAFDPSSLGTDLNIGITDVPAACGVVGGLTNLGNVCLRRLFCELGGLFYDKNYGKNLLNLLNASLSATEIAKEQAETGAEIEKDERFQSCQAAFDFDAGTEQMFITLTGTLATGTPYQFVIVATALTVALFSVNGIPVVSATTPAQPAIQLVVGPPGKDGPVGATGSDGAGGTPQFTGDFGDQDGENSDGTEEVIYQRLVNLDVLPATITFDLNAYDSSTAGTGTFKMSYGGTPWNADGVAVGSPMTTGSASPVKLQATATISNPGGKMLVKITAQSSANGQTATMGADRTLTIR